MLFWAVCWVSLLGQFGASEVAANSFDFYKEEVSGENLSWGWSEEEEEVPQSALEKAKNIFKKGKEIGEWGEYAGILGIGGVALAVLNDSVREKVLLACSPIVFSLIKMASSIGLLGCKLMNEESRQKLKTAKSFKKVTSSLWPGSFNLPLFFVCVVEIIEAIKEE